MKSLLLPDSAPVLSEKDGRAMGNLCPGYSFEAIHKIYLFFELCKAPRTSKSIHVTFMTCTANLMKLVSGSKVVEILQTETSAKNTKGSGYNYTKKH